jgi:hypothetical protein
MESDLQMEVDMADMVQVVEERRLVLVGSK